MSSRNDIINTIANAYQKPGASNISQEELSNYIQSAVFLEDILHFSRTAYLIVECKRWEYLYCSANAAEVLGWETKRRRLGFGKLSHS